MKLSFDRVTSALFREFRNVINKFIGDSEDNFKEITKKINDTQTSLNGVVETANSANTKADDAKTTADSLESQLDQIIKDGNTSGAEVSAARVGYDGTTYSTLKGLLDSWYMKIFDLQYIEKNKRYLSRSFNTMKRNSSMSIVCVGDSLTYGADSYSTDKRAAKTDATLPADCTSTNTQASTTYPEKLQQFFNSYWGGESTSKVTVINRGIPGDKSTDGYTRYPYNPNSQVAIIGYGANDIGNLNPNDFFKALCNIAKRYIDYGNGVIFLSIPRRASTSSTLEIVSYNAIIKQVAEYFGSPFIDLGAALTGYEANLIYSDANKEMPLDDRVHFNGLGYSIISAKVFAKLIEICSPNPLKVRNNDYISSFTYASPLFYKGMISYDLEGTASGDLPASSTNGFYMQIGVGQTVTYSFMAEESDMLLLPHFHNNSTATKCEITIDGGVQQAKPQIPTMLRNAAYIRQNDGTIVTPKSVYAYPDGFSARTALAEYVEADINDKVIQLSQKGLHTITIKNAGTDGVLYWFGLMCFSYYDGLKIINSQ